MNIQRCPSAITEEELGVVKELVEESMLAGSAKDDLNGLRPLSPGLACNFSDLSSIEALPMADPEAKMFRFEPARGVECMESIPMAVALLHQLADKVIDHDEKIEALARKRAVRLSISTSFTTVFNNQVSE